MNSDKLVMWTAITLGGLLGAYLPVWFFRVDPLDSWSLFGSTVGGILGIWVWHRFLRN